MTYCYTAMDSPAFFAQDGDCGVIKHDLRIKEGDLKRTGIGDVNSIISAVLIQLNTDQVNDGNRGWWGDELLGFNIGAQLWTLKDYPASERTVMADSMIRAALEPIIKQGLIDDFTVSISQIVGGIEAEIDIIKDGSTLFKVLK